LSIYNSYLLSSEFTTQKITNDKGFVTANDLSVYRGTSNITNNDKNKIYIRLGGISHEIDCSDFIKDGMIESVEVNHDTKELIITWNVDSNSTSGDKTKKTSKIPLSYFNIYKNGNGIKFGVYDDEY
jgi:hypothetical protein